MKKIKLLCIMGLLFLVTGCNADYTLTIDQNLNFTEEIRVNEDSSYFTINGQNIDEYIKMQKKIYQNNEPYSLFDYKINKTQTTTGVTGIRIDMSLDTFANNSILYGSLFSSIQVTHENNQLKFTTLDYAEHFFEKSVIPLDPYYQRVTFTLKTPFKVIQSNADSMNADTGVYTWNFDKNTQPKNVEFVLDTRVSEKEQVLNIMEKFWYIPCIVLVLLIGIVKIMITIRKNNKI